MGSSSETLPLVVACAALVVSALSSATSAALAALGEHRAAALLEDREEGLPFGLRAVVHKPDAVRLALLCVDTLAKLAVGLSLASLVALYPEGGALPVALAAGVALVTLVVITVARAAAARDPERSLSWAAPVGAGAEWVLRPLTAPLTALARITRGASAPALHGTTEELEYLIEKGAKSGALDEARRDLLESVIEFSGVRVREIMVPRPKVVALAADASYDEVIQLVVDSGHSRVPVFQDSVDNVIGVLYAKRLLEDLGKVHAAGRAKFRLADCLTAPFFVPETMKISHLLAEFQRRGLQIAVVVDEFGGTSGVVTLEDVVEEIVGEIRDESDEEEQQPIRQVGPGIFVAEGEASIRDVEEFLSEALDDDFEFPEEGDYETVGGFVTSMAGRVPRLGERVEHDGLTFTVRGADEKRVARVEIAVSPDRLPRRRDEEPPARGRTEEEELGEEPAAAPVAFGEGMISRLVGLRR